MLFLMLGNAVRRGGRLDCRSGAGGGRFIAAERTDVQEVCDRWELHHAVIGAVTNDAVLRAFAAGPDPTGSTVQSGCPGMGGVSVP